MSSLIIQCVYEVFNYRSRYKVRCFFFFIMRTYEGKNPLPQIIIKYSCHHLLWCKTHKYGQIRESLIEDNRSFLMNGSLQYEPWALSCTRHWWGPPSCRTHPRGQPPSGRPTPPGWWSVYCGRCGRSWRWADPEPHQKSLCAETVCLQHCSHGLDHGTDHIVVRVLKSKWGRFNQTHQNIICSKYSSILENYISLWTQLPIISSQKFKIRNCLSS